MKFAVSHSLKRAGAGVAIAAALISATGCGYIYTQPTTLQYAASDGVKADLNGVELRNIMMVSSGKGADGRLLGTILNKSDHDITVTFAFPSGEKSVKVAKGQQVRLESNDSQVIVPKISQTPGETLANTQVSSNDQSTTLNIPVLDGTLKEYASYMPNAASSRASSQSSHAATPSASTPAKTPTHRQLPFPRIRRPLCLRLLNRQRLLHTTNLRKSPPRPLRRACPSTRTCSSAGEVFTLSRYRKKALYMT